MLFDGEVAIVTGGARGIGEEIAREFAREGAIPVIFDIDDQLGNQVVSDIIKEGKEALFVHCDVSNVSNLETAVKVVEEKYNQINILVNNAGILHSTKVEDITEGEWDKMMSINLKSVFFAIQKVLPAFEKAKGGKVVNISSLAGRMGGFANGLGYTATKAAMIGLTYGFARRLADRNINVNAIAPGPTETEILKAFTEEKKEELRHTIPLKKLGETRDIANAVVFLASEKAKFITGAVLDVNGGMFMG